MLFLLHLILPFIKRKDIGGSSSQLLKLDLQFFADDKDKFEDNGEDKDPYRGNIKNPENDKNEEKTFTQEQVNRIIQARVARADIDKEEAVKEAKRLSKINVEKKWENELKKLKRENEELKAAQNKYELGRQASRALSASGITATEEILEFVVREDVEKTGEAVRVFSELVVKISNEKMKEKLKGKPPKA